MHIRDQARKDASAGDRSERPDDVVLPSSMMSSKHRQLGSLGRCVCQAQPGDDLLSGRREALPPPPLTGAGVLHLLPERPVLTSRSAACRLRVAGQSLEERNQQLAHGSGDASIIGKPVGSPPNPARGSAIRPEPPALLRCMAVCPSPASSGVAAAACLRIIDEARGLGPRPPRLEEARVSTSSPSGNAMNPFPALWTRDAGLLFVLSGLEPRDQLAQQRA
ncbi:hypothetical protein JHW43_003615 [Diplocarpon mali]|nr:hypothetical protein JHW43_003615 [Diplocarpon mali]